MPHRCSKKWVQFSIVERIRMDRKHFILATNRILSKVNKITPILKVLGAISGAMILVIAGLFIYQGLSIATTAQ